MRDPGVAVDVLGQRALVVPAGLDAGGGDVAEQAAGREPRQALSSEAERKKASRSAARLGREPEARVQLGDEDVPAAHAHDDEDEQRALGDEVALRPQRGQPVGVVDRLARRRGRWRRGDRRGRGRRRRRRGRRERGRLRLRGAGARASVAGPADEGRGRAPPRRRRTAERGAGRPEGRDIVAPGTGAGGVETGSASAPAGRGGRDADIIAAGCRRSAPSRAPRATGRGTAGAAPPACCRG